MKRIIYHLKNYLHWYLLGYVFILSWILAFHNIPLYHYKHGFDGGGHVEYLQYIEKNGSLPPANLGWETHQAPLYYLIGSVAMSDPTDWKSAQYINIFILWIIIGTVFILLRKIFQNNQQAAIGASALGALPMLNIFPVMITNELLNTMWSILVIAALVFLLKTKSVRSYVIISAGVTLFFILGFWTKVSIIMIGPLIAGVYLYLLIQAQIPRKIQLLTGAMMAVVVISSCIPIYMRGADSEGPSNLANVITSSSEGHDMVFYTRLDWIPKVDMYNTQYYSALGGAWNSFFSDGHNVLTPFVPFHKKAFILWTLGFVLFPLSSIGLYKLYKKDKVYGIFAVSVGLLMFAVYIYYNSKSSHYSAARLTYEMPIVVAYAIGLAASVQKNRLIMYGLYALLFIQMTVLVSFYWIEPWWHVTQGY